MERPLSGLHLTPGSAQLLADNVSANTRPRNHADRAGPYSHQGRVNEHPSPLNASSFSEEASFSLLPKKPFTVSFRYASFCRSVRILPTLQGEMRNK